VKGYSRSWVEGVDVALEVMKEQHISILPSLSKVLEGLDSVTSKRLVSQLSVLVWGGARLNEVFGAHLARRSIAF